MKDYSLIQKCPITEDSNLFTYLDLGNFPLVNNLCFSKDESLNCKKYPLKVNYFPSSKLSTLSHAINSKLMFNNYVFKTGVNKPYIKHSKKMFEKIKNKVSLDQGDLIVDIGGNDGTLLKTFSTESTKDYQYLNIDPSINLSKECKSKGIPVLTEFFSSSTSNKVNSKAKVIISTNVFQHLLDINSFTEGIYNLLEENGMWVLEFPYWIHDLDTFQFDQIYHEHMYYYSVTPLNKLINKHNLKIVDIEPQTIHGGTLRLYIAKSSSNFPLSNKTVEYLSKEKQYNLKYYKKWGEKILNQTQIWKKEILKLKSQNKKIAAFGAAAKGCIFLNTLNLTNEEIDYIIDDTDLKQGKYMPGTGIPILSRDILSESSPDYMIILAHNFLDYIIKSMPSYKGKFIAFLPEFKIISNE